jgi:hypothetical protein
LAAEALSASENQVKLYFKVIGLNNLQRWKYEVKKC